MPSWEAYRAQVRSGLANYVERPIARLLAKIGLSPNKVTVIGLLLSGIIAYLLSVGQFVGGGVLLIIASAMDMADGALARLQAKSTTAGALLDSTADRISEAVVFLGLLVFFINPLSIPEVVLIYLAVSSSFMVSYLRARGEGLGVDCKVGVMTRPERVLVLAVGLLINQIAVALGIIVALSFLTALHRFWHIQGELSRR
ncbi:CDP-alcohol phosphatidyltransferase family protein [SAR202 cluster bacterium AC-647-N09_OGT_505m]|nr:CDP-alcohol phosphatidyltransferase family protein [SAR202 cluster bacterium AC-647-N09_OGT_505m]